MSIREQALQEHDERQAREARESAERYSSAADHNVQALASLLIETLGADNGEYRTYADETARAWATFEGMPGIEFAVEDRPGPGRRLTVRRIVPDPPDTPEYTDWGDNPRNYNIEMWGRIGSLSDLGAYLRRLEEVGEAVVKPWTAKEMARWATRDKGAKKGAFDELSLSEMNNSTRSFRVVCLAQVVNEVPYYLVEYLGFV